MKAGVARMVITPDRPICLAGYAARTKHSEGVYHPLSAKALVLEEGDSRAAAITTDLIGFNRVACDEVKAAVAREAGLTPEQVVVSASHTHTGPEMRLGRPKYVDAFDEAYAKDLCRGLGPLVAEAANALEPATLDFATAPCTLGVNRRLKTDEGVAMRPNAAGPTDPEVCVLRARRADGSPLAVLMSYPCHPTTLGGYLVGADYPGFAQDAVEAAYDGCTALFMQGCGGDVKVRNVDGCGRFRSGPWEAAQSLGEELGRAALLALGGETRAVAGGLAVRLEEVELPPRDPPTRERAEEMAAHENPWFAKWGREMLRILDAGEAFDPSKTFTVHALTIGDFVLVGLSGEMCVGYSLRLKRDLAPRPAIIAGYTNGMIGYVPNRAIMDEGGYEVDQAYLYDLTPAPFAYEVEDVVCSRVCEIVGAMGVP